VTLRLPANRLTQLNLRYYGGPVTNVVAVGSKGSVMLDPSSALQVCVLAPLRLGALAKSCILKRERLVMLN